MKRLEIRIVLFNIGTLAHTRSCSLVLAALILTLAFIAPQDFSKPTKTYDSSRIKWSSVRKWEYFGLERSFLVMKCLFVVSSPILNVKSTTPSQLHMLFLPYCLFALIVFFFSRN